uniref:3'-5' exonuclease domain-containing protein n=1 Tax=Globisporangium ultimum (strain ATCC 200006 / CBS 805.95 / DAOM BR144) TaxID=431595 RepID=K3W9R8_GLOUD
MDAHHPHDAATPPPPPPPPPLPPTLAELFQEFNVAAAVTHLRHMDSAQAKVEIPDAFLLVHTAPSSFLLCVNALVEQGKVMSHLNAVETAVVCIRSMADPLISGADVVLAGSLLSALQSCRVSLLAGFITAYRVREADVAAFCEHILTVKAYTAIHLMESLNMRHLLPVEVVLTAAIAQDDVRAGDIFVKRNRDHQVLFVQMLLANNIGDKIIKKRITDFKLDVHAFPEYVYRKKLSALRYMVYTDKFEDVLKFVTDDGDDALKEYACRILFEKKGGDHPATKHFVHTLKLAHVFPYVDLMTIDGDGSDDARTMGLPAQDEYDELDSCLSLAECIGAENIVFVDTLESVHACVAHLKTQSVVGFDCEWKATHGAITAQRKDGATTLVRDPCATLQLASAHKAFVLDTIALDEDAIGAPLASIFGDDAILKLGFDTKGDLKLLRVLLGSAGRHTDGTVVSRLLDLQAVMRKLYAQGLVATAATALDTTALKDEKGDKENSGESGEQPTGSSENSEDTGEDSKASLDEAAANAAVMDGDAPASITDETDAKRKKKKKQRVVDPNAKNALSLTGVAELYLGKPLDKRARMSNWERRPLTRAQLHYAALDAHVLVRILQQMQQRHPHEAFDAIVRRCTQINLR